MLLTSCLFSETDRQNWNHASFVTTVNAVGVLKPATHTELCHVHSNTVWLCINHDHWTILSLSNILCREKSFWIYHKNLLTFYCCWGPVPSRLAAWRSHCGPGHASAAGTWCPAPAAESSLPPIGLAGSVRFWGHTIIILITIPYD